MIKTPKIVFLTTEEYQALKRRDLMLSAFEAGGVDNWDWYSESLKDFWKEEEEDA